jgi:hypothetical protein
VLGDEHVVRSERRASDAGQPWMWTEESRHLDAQVVPQTLCYSFGTASISHRATWKLGRIPMRPVRCSITRLARPSGFVERSQRQSLDSQSHGRVQLPTAGAAEKGILHAACYPRERAVRALRPDSLHPHHTKARQGAAPLRSPRARPTTKLVGVIRSANTLQSRILSSLR